ncbi:C40 family peptidase [Oribacterium sp. WCC10]|uniref:C40 family peptidase n=1 Tax=Oribacterium sp. WCC10 TaxID=1855343 RepID=UPI0008F414A6|nr:C40 family peptidase [Oribacterium sp. WCC10]SFG75865.1 NlpC/P60 family protein [Oribacterium sp. WCC10]
MEIKKINTSEESPENVVHDKKYHLEQNPRAPGDKLMNEASARRAVRKKLRFGRADMTRTTEEIMMEEQKQLQGRRAIRREFAAREALQKEIDKANEDENVGVEAVNDTSNALLSADELLDDHQYSERLKREYKSSGFGGYDGCQGKNWTDWTGDGEGDNLADASAESGGSLSGLTGGPSARRDNTAYSGYGGKLASDKRDLNMNTGKKATAGESLKTQQKMLMKKEYQKAAFERARKESANSFGSLTRRFVDKAEDLSGKLMEFIKESIEEHPGVLISIVLVLVVLALIIGITSSGGVFVNSLGSTTLESSFTADDPEILAVDNSYKEKEAVLQSRIDNIETEYPDYDEYKYELDTIYHNPYELAALLTVLHEDYTEERSQESLNEIFEKQYSLTTESVTEIRTRTETHSHTVTEPDGSTSTDYYDVEVEYEYHILKVKLTSASMDSIITEMGLNDDQKARYDLLVETLGNKGTLFASDPYAAQVIGDYEGYEVPPEALTDTKFARMINEAEKYLGYPYVWGGSSPSTSFDCSGFVSWVINHSGNGWNVGRETANGLLGHCTRISKAEAKPGDLIFFQGTYNTKGASHVGIYVGDGMMIHCGKPIQYASVNTDYWTKHFMTYGRIVG